MRLFDFPRAPNPRRVRIFLAEKGLAIEKIPVNLFRMEQISPEFLALNPGGTVPLLETDEGEFLSESLAIASYLEARHPQPPLMGTSPLISARVLMWNNICENEGFSSIAEVLRNLSPGFRNRVFPGPANIEQIPALVERGKIRAEQFFDRIEKQLDKHQYLAGTEFTFADITLLTLVDFAGWVEISPTTGRPHLKRWFGEVAERPSSAA